MRILFLLLLLLLLLSQHNGRYDLVSCGRSARQPFFQLLQLYLSDTKVSDTVITVIITGADYRYGHDASTVQSELSHFILKSTVHNFSVVFDPHIANVRFSLSIHVLQQVYPSDD